MISFPIKVRLQNRFSLQTDGQMRRRQNLLADTLAHELSAIGTAKLVGKTVGKTVEVGACPADPLSGINSFCPRLMDSMSTMLFQVAISSIVTRYAVAIDHRL